MIYEYAIDPEFFIDLINEKQLLNSFIREIKRGCIVLSDYPESLGTSTYTLLNKREKDNNDAKLKSNIQKKKSILIEIKKALMNLPHTNRYNVKQWNGSFLEEQSYSPKFGQVC